MPARIVGGIGADLRVNTAKWSRGFKTARKDLKGFNAGLKATAAKLLAFAAVGLSVRKLVSVFNETRLSLDSLAKTADRLDTSALVLKAFGLAADKAGSSTEEIRKALTFMNRTIGEAITSGGEYEQVLDDIGLTSKELVDLSLQDQFTKIAAAINKLPTAAQRTSAAMGLFSRSGANMLTLIKGGGDAIEDARLKIKAWGGEISGQGLRNVQAMNDQLTELGTRFEVFKEKQVAELSNQFLKMSDRIEVWGAKAKHAFEEAGSALSLAFGSGTRPGIILEPDQVLRDVGLDPTGGFFRKMAEKLSDRLAKEKESIQQVFTDSIQEGLVAVENALPDNFDEEIKRFRLMHEEKVRIAKAAAEREKQIRESNQQQAFGFLHNMTSMLASESKAWFEINKAVGIADAIVNTNEAMTKALAFGPIAGPIMAGVIGAAGLAHVAAIASTTFEGGGSIPNTAGAAGATEAAANQAPQRIVNLTIEGDGPFGRDTVISLGRQMAELAEDGVDFRVAGG